jgi:glycine/D-amino acid oxidase-like deaminating enzyme
VVDPPAPGPGSTGEIASSKQDLLISRLSRYFPALAQPGVVRGWTGLRTFSPDRRPVLGPDPDLQGLWWAAGLGGAGLSSCIGVGEALSAWMEGHTTDWLDPAPLCPGRTPLRKWSILSDGDPQHARLVDAHPA